MLSVSGAHRDSRIEGLRGARGLAGCGDGVRLLGVDSVTDVRSDIGSVSGKRMGEGSGKGGGTDLIEVTDDSEDTTERPAKYGLRRWDARGYSIRAHRPSYT